MKFNNGLALLLVVILAASFGCKAGGSSAPSGTSNNNSGSGGNGAGSTTVTGLSISPASQTITPGATATFAAIGILSDGSTEVLTSSTVSWGSSSTAIATVNSGIATASSSTTGTVTITAQYSTFSAVANLTVTPATASGGNVMTVTVNGSLCSTAPYPNKPCVSVKICEPGSTTACQTVSDILLDTGSVGLRIFKSALGSVSLSQITSGSKSLAECYSFLAGNSFWGPVMQAEVYLGGETTISIPVQVLDSTFGTVPPACVPAATSPSVEGMNGILGVGFTVQDCGSACVTHSNVFPSYYLCSGTTCTASTASLTNQVQNPVASLPGDNNGVILQLPTVAAGGVTSTDGSLIFGIDTQSNNTSSGVTAYPLDANGYLKTTFNGSTCSTSFIDSGSNGLFFPPSGKITLCTDPAFNGWYCPTSTTALSATIIGSSGSPSNAAAFDISNAQTLFGSGKNTFSDLGGAANTVSNSSTCSSANEYFDWGLPFFFGKSVYLGFQGKSSSLGTGPYHAF